MLLGCSGGLMDFTLQFVVAIGGLDTERSHPSITILFVLIFF